MGKKHRGFGFVIFYEKHSLDQLLGEDFSRFVCFPDDIKLEVKRAVGKTSTCAHTNAEQPSAGRSKQLEKCSPQAQQSDSSAGSFAQSQPNSLPQHGQGPMSKNKETEVHALPTSSSSSRTCCASPAVTQTWQSVPSQAVLVTYVSLPWVPPFPRVDSPQVQWPLGNSLPLTTSQPQPSADLQSKFRVVPNVLEEFVGSKPLNSQELELALLEAMPDHYDD